MLKRLTRTTTLVAGVGALLTTLFAWTTGPALGACTPQQARTAHARWTLTLDGTSCAPSQNEYRVGEQFEVIVPNGPGFVAMGRMAEDPYTGAPRAWASFTSDTGEDWAAHLLPFSGAQFETGVDMASGGGLIVLVGAGFGSRSSDGVVWQVAARPPAASSRVTAITGSNTGWLAVGQTTRTGSRAAVWLSADGLDWTRVRDQAVFGRFCASAVTWRSNRYVVVGSDCNGRPAALASTDGVHWRRSPSQSAFARQGVARDVVCTASGFLAAGEDRSAAGARGTAFWTSTDGLSWRRVAFFSAPRGGETFVTLVRTTAGYFGLSDTGDLTAGQPPGSFYSGTGATWRRDGLLPNPGFGSEDGDWLTDATAVGARIVAVGIYNDIDAGYYHAGGLITIGDALR